MISAGSRRLPGETGAPLLMLQVLGDGVGVFPRAGHQNKTPPGSCEQFPTSDFSATLINPPKLPAFLFPSLDCNSSAG